MRNTITILLMLLVYGVKGQEQGHSLQGVVKGERGEVLPYVSVSLIGDESSAFPNREAFADEQGVFTYTNIPTGDYILTVSNMGYEPARREVKVLADLVLDTIVLYEDATALRAVTVTATRRVLERRSDRFVMNVANSSFQASNVLDIFQSLPFMQVQGDQFSINGKRNILVLLDNVQMPGVSVSQILNSMTGNDIDRIEFITTPGARYDASIDAVIHIHTKQGQKEGWAGSATANYSQGQYGRGAIGGNVTYRKGKWAVGTRYNHNRGISFIERSGYRTIGLADRDLTIGATDTELYHERSHNTRINIGYALAENHDINVSAGWTIGSTPDSELNGQAEFSNGPTGGVDSILSKMLDIYYRFNTNNYSVNYQGKLDDMGKRVDFIGTYTAVRNRNYTEILRQDMRSTDGSLLEELPIIRNDNPTNADIWILQNDWELPFENDWQVEAGLKYSHSQNHTETQQSQRVNGAWTDLPDFTFVNNFHENIVAGYAGVQKKIANTTLRAFLRAENTQMGVKGVYERKFFDLFPNVMLQQKVGDRTIMLNYRKSIYRPGFNQMAPWRIYTDEYLVVEGNLNLKPTYTNQIILNGNILDNLFLELEYYDQRDLVVQLARQEGEQTLFAPINIDGSQWAANLTYDYRLTSWWSGNTYLRGYRWSYEGVVNEAMVEENGYAYTFGVTGSFRLPLGVRMDATYNYQSPEGYGGRDILRMNFARVAVRKTFLQDRLTATLAVNDIFQGQLYRGTQQAGNLNRYFSSYQDTRRVTLGMVFNFGKKTVKQVENKKLGNEDLIHRAGN